VRCGLTTQSRAAAITVLAATVWAAPERTVVPSVGDPAWRAVTIPGVERSTAYDVRNDAAGTFLRAESHCAASGMAVALSDVDLAATPVLRWRWRIEKGLAIADERTREGDDFAARVIVMFEFDPAQATWSERGLHALAETWRGETLPGRSLAYVWTSEQPLGRAWRNPYRAPTFLISRGRGRSSDWRSEHANVVEDYRRHWGAEPPAVAGIGVLTDADNTCGEAIADYADFRFVSEAE
jgi:hypothetical protein